MKYENFEYELRDGAAFVTLITPDADTLGDICDECLDLLLRLQEEPEARVILLSDGLRPFDLSPGLETLAELRCAGNDFAELAPALENARRVVTAIQEYSKPVVAAAAGCVREAGFGLFLAADFRLAADTATFQAPDAARGLLPEWGLLHNLPRLVGQSRALELLWSGRTVGAAEAARIGLVERIVPAARWEEELDALAARLASLPQPAVRLLKLAVQQSALFDFTAMLDLEYEAQQQCWAGPETAEGMASFLHGRAPDFTAPPSETAEED
jgi:2-(1,2-epoxy-1,2-dihydrophenyl)acetyl-CoA isomerase